MINTIKNNNDVIAPCFAKALREGKRETSTAAIRIFTKHIVFILTMFFLITSCNSWEDSVSLKNDTGKGPITVTGIAQNQKDGAVLHTKEKVYYLEGLSSWPEEELNKEITITGSVRTEEREYVNSDPEKGIISQGVPQPENTKEKTYTVTWLVNWKRK